MVALRSEFTNTHLVCRDLGLTDYQATLLAMQTFTAHRTTDTPDELWLTSHQSIYTLGLNRKNVRLPQNNIPLVLVDRGGKITYHGLGQVVIYFLIDLKRRKLVTMMETCIIDLLAQFSVAANTKKDAPGVYIANKKIASLGLRLKNNCCYHGLSLNVDMDLAPFNAIDPCGYADLEITQTIDLGVNESPARLGNLLLEKIVFQLRK
jgi:lipoyl(octanoyl) transferase